MNPSLPAKFTIKLLMPLMALSALLIMPEVKAQIRITEYLYSGANGEFVEFTNVGSTSIDMTGWSFDDITRHPGVHNLSAFGIVQPGESVIVTESDPSVFRSAWGLCAGIKITGNYTNDNLGRADEINLYDASSNLVDRLTYDDQSLGGPRANGASAWVTAAGLGANNPTLWTLSTVGDSEGSFRSSGGDIGSPGKSTRATVAFNPCVVVNGAPTIIIDVAATTNYLDGGASASPASPYTLSGVINDPTDPATVYGIDFTIGDDATPVDNLTVTVSSNNPTVVPDANLNLSGSGASRNLKIVPAAVGYATITVTVNDGTLSTPYTLLYAASANSLTPDKTRWHTGISDASNGIALDSAYYVTGDDEQDVLNVYSRSNSGLPVKSYDYTSFLNLPDPSKPEVDVEATVKSPAIANRVYWLGSMSNGKAPFDNKPNRNRLFATTITGTGAATAFSFAGYYGNLRDRLIAWGDANGYDFSSSAAAGVDSKTPSGFAAEGMVFGPDDSTLYIGLRAPLVPVANRTKAVIAPILNFEAWFNNGSPSGDPVFGAPIELDLGGRGIRDLIRMPNGTYVILAGNPAESPVTGAIYKWKGRAGDAPVLVSSPATDTLNIEGAMPVYTGDQLILNSLQVITDKGADVLYNDGVEAKDLSSNDFKKFRSDVVTLGDSLKFNQPPVVTITSPADGSSFNVIDTITLHAEASDADGSIVRVVFYDHGVQFAADSTAPYEFIAANVDPGSYAVTAKAFDDKGDSAVSDTVRITITGCSGTGTISAEGFTDIPGSQLINLSSSQKYPDNPDVTAQLNKFEYGPNIRDNYGARVRGYICAPQTGNYTFYIASDDQSELWLSTDDNPANIQRIAYVSSYTGFHSWFSAPTQRSAVIHLIKGVRYYVETIHKEGSGGDHLSVGWVLPNGTFEGPIPGSVLSPWQTGGGGGFESAMTKAAGGLTVQVKPNPTSTQFTINTSSNSDELLTVEVADVLGRVIERRQQVPANGTIELGSNYRQGIYFVSVIQGAQQKRIKLIKQ